MAVTVASGGNSKNGDLERHGAAHHFCFYHLPAELSFQHCGFCFCACVCCSVFTPVSLHQVISCGEFSDARTFNATLSRCRSPPHRLSERSRSSTTKYCCNSPSSHGRTYPAIIAQALLPQPLRCLVLSREEPGLMREIWRGQHRAGQVTARAGLAVSRGECLFLARNNVTPGTGARGESG